MPPPPNILIVEDEPILAENIKDLLDSCVANVRVVSDGEHAVELMGTFSPDAVVMDYWLPGMNGVETYAKMSRASPTKIDCVMISGECEETLNRLTADRGIRSVLTKPFSFAELLDRLEPAPARETGAQCTGEQDPEISSGLA